LEFIFTPDRKEIEARPLADFKGIKSLQGFSYRGKANKDNAAYAPVSEKDEAEELY
jgi:hypothetical protein